MQTPTCRQELASIKRGSTPEAQWHLQMQTYVQARFLDNTAHQGQHQVQEHGEATCIQEGLGGGRYVEIMQSASTHHPCLGVNKGPQTEALIGQYAPG